MRFVMAAICSVALCALMAALYLLGLMPGAVAASGAALILGSVLAFALVFRWRLNLSATDPSLTVPMTMVAVLCVLYVMPGPTSRATPSSVFSGWCCCSACSATPRARCCCMPA